MEQPLGWLLSVLPVETKLSGTSPKPWTKQFPVDQREAAEAEKRAEQALGRVATVTPIWPSRRKVIKKNKLAQINPFGRFNIDWVVFE